jgi:hypothetical protein
MLEVCKPQRLTSAGFSDFNARPASEAAGNLTVVWQSFWDRNGDIYTSRFSATPGGPRHDGHGTLWMVFRHWTVA